MTPEELLALYAPFVLSWCLVWLTNESEKEAISAHQPPANDEDPAAEFAEQPAHQPRHHRVRKHHRSAETHTAELIWNVSNFFGLKQSAT